MKITFYHKNNLDLEHSTIRCLWYPGLDNSEMAGAAFFDLRKAFDTVDHSLLCGKLESMESEMASCVGLCLILQAESNFAELMGQTLW